MNLDWTSQALLPVPGNWGPINRSTQDIADITSIVQYARRLEQRFGSAQGWTFRLRSSSDIYMFGQHDAATSSYPVLSLGGATGDAALSAATQSLASAGIPLQYISLSSAWPAIGPEGTYGARRDMYGGVMVGKVVGGVWVQQYEPTLTEASMVTRVQTAWMDPTGSDVRGYVGREFRPFKTFAGVLAAFGSETGAKLILGNGTHDGPLDDTVWRDRLSITGQGMGFYAPDNLSIVGPGTVIRGGVSMYRHSYLSLDNLAVDAGSAARAAIGQPDGPGGPGHEGLHIYNWDRTGAVQPQMIDINLSRIRALGEAVDAPYHAVLCEGVLTGTFREIHTMKNTHGFVLKGTECTVDGLYGVGHGTNAGIFRNSSPYGFTQRLQVSRLFAKPLAAPRDTGGFNFVANGPGETLTNFTVNQVNAFQTKYGLSFDASNGGTIANGVVSNAQIDGAQYVGVGTAGGVQRVQFSAISVTAPLANGIDLGAGGNSISLTDARVTAAGGHGLNNAATDTRVNSGEFTSSTGNDINNTAPGGILKIASAVRYSNIAGVVSVDGHVAATLVALTNGWSNLGGAHLPAGYRKSATGEVALQGHIQGGTVGQIAFILPMGFRPTGLVRYACNSNANALAGIAITAAGEVYVEVAPGWLSLDVIRFFVD